MSAADKSAMLRLAHWLTLALIVTAAVELLAAGIYHFVLLPRAHFLVWSPDLDRARRVFEAEASMRDEELGWPAPQALTQPPRDRTGAKLNADFPGPQTACAAAYGDSFVWGDDIPLADGWIEQLSRRLGCRVANYGVPGYGTDQAYLRFRRTADVAPPVVLLGIFPENIMRNVNQYRPMIGFEVHPSWLKGRFVLDSHGGLEWVSPPKLDADGFVALNHAPAEVLPHEYLLPDSRDGPVSARWPYLRTLIHVASMPRLRVRIGGRPSWSEFYDANHPSGGLQLTVAIAESFVREAERHGIRALIVMLPGASSFAGQARHGGFEYEPLVARLRAKAVEVFDPGAPVLAALGRSSYCELYFQAGECAGHFGVAGSALFADVVAAELRRRGLVGH